MRTLKCCLVLFLLPLFGSLAFADTLLFTGAATNTTLTIHDNTLGTVTGYIDPYLGKLNGVPLTIFCVDPDHDVRVGDLWNVNITVAPTSDWSNTRLGNATLYGEMAYLAGQMLATNDVTTRREIQTVIWWLADNSLTATLPGGTVLDPSQHVGITETYLTAAQLHARTSGFEILSDTTGAKQEYLVLTPEPSTFVLLISGMIGGWIKRRKK